MNTLQSCSLPPAPPLRFPSFSSRCRRCEVPPRGLPAPPPFLPPPPGVAVGAALSTVGGQATLCFNCADGTHDAYALVGAAVAHWERLRAAAGE